MHFVNNVVSADTGNVFFTSFLTLPRYVWRSPDFGCTNESDDAASAYLQSLLWCITGQEQYADHAIAVLNAYAYGLDEYNNSNAPLQAGWSLMQFSKAAELLTHGRGLQASRYDEKDRAALVEMLHRTTVPLIIDGSGANGNWELSMLDGLIGLAVFSDNTTLFQHTIDLWKQRLPSYFYVEALDGSSPVPPPRGHPTWYDQKVFNASIDGHCQETCRDLGHTQMGFASAIDCAYTAGLQGVDLLGEADTQLRVTSAMEYHAAYLLNHPVPEFVCPDEAGVGNMSFAPTFEVAYDAYHRQRNVSLPLTAQHIEENVRTQVKCEAWRCDDGAIVLVT